MQIAEQPLTHVEKAVAKFSFVEFDARVEAYQKLASEKSATLQRLMLRRGIAWDRASVDLSFKELAAQDYGFDSFAHMDGLLHPQFPSFESAERAAVAAAYVGNEARVAQILRINDRLTNESPAIALSLGISHSLDWLDSIDVNSRLGPMGWHPITYVCCSQVCVDIDGEEVPRKLVRQLIEFNANPSEGLYESDTIRGYLTVLGGAVGFRRDGELVELLLGAGADIDDGPTLYEGCAMWYAVEQNDAVSMKLLLNANAPLWHLCHALPHAIDLEHYKIVDQLLSAGADPNWDKTAKSYGGNSLHEAIFVGSTIAVARKLVDSKANLDQSNGGGITPTSAATALNRTEYIQFLKELGVDTSECRDLDRWVGACFAHDQNLATEMAGLLPSPDQWRFEDHLWLCHAVRNGDLGAVKLLLNGGTNPGAVDYDGNSALHLAATSGSRELCKMLVRKGAAIDAVNFEGRLPLDCALAELHCDDELVELLGDSTMDLPDSRLSLQEQDAFEEAASAIPEGDLEKLRSICEINPKFANARSPRPHHSTLLNYIGVNGFEGERQITPPNVLEVMDYLIDEVGCDTKAWNYTYRGGPGNNTVGLLTSSGHPREMGLTLAMTHKMVVGGAEVSAGWQFLIEMHGHRIEGTLDEFLADSNMNAESSIEAFLEAGNLGEMELVGALMRAGMDPNVSSWGNVRALHNAAINGDRGLVELLLEAGADPTLRDSQFNGNAAGWADAGGHEDLARFLVQRIRNMESD
ncbi:MAG: ankyrin repeat domain-containing protein [Gammaproteobacteria bacterium]|nr:ankyrin repeat domain-containing protein [Gammaproteobacteria bacterium]